MNRFVVVEDIQQQPLSKKDPENERETQLQKDLVRIDNFKQSRDQISKRVVQPTMKDFIRAHVINNDKKKKGVTLKNGTCRRTKWVDKNESIWEITYAEQPKTPTEIAAEVKKTAQRRHVSQQKNNKKIK